MRLTEAYLDLRGFAAGKTTAEAAAAYNAGETRHKERYVDWSAMANLIGRERAAAVSETLDVLVASPDTPADVKAVCRLTLKMLGGRGIDMGNQQTREAMPGFVSLGVLTQDEADLLLNEGVAAVVPSLASMTFGRDVTETDVTAAQVAGEVFDWIMDREAANLAVLGDEAAAGLTVEQLKDAVRARMV